MAPLARYPDAQSPYWIEHCSGLYRVHHEREGLIAECDCLAEARHQISDAEDAEAELAAAERALIEAEHERGERVLAALDRRAA